MKSTKTSYQLGYKVEGTPPHISANKEQFSNLVLQLNTFNTLSIIDWNQDCVSINSVVISNQS